MAEIAESINIIKQLKMLWRDDRGQLKVDHELCARKGHDEVVQCITVHQRMRYVLSYDKYQRVLNVEKHSILHDDGGNIP